MLFFLTGYYNITNQNGRVVRFCLLKSSYRLGEDIIGVFDFSKATVKCVQVSFTLCFFIQLQYKQLQILIAQWSNALFVMCPKMMFFKWICYNTSLLQFSVTLVSEEELQEDCKGRTKQSITTVAYNKHHEFSLHLNLTQIILPIPLTVTPAFSTNIGKHNFYSLNTYKFCVCSFSWG